jgi:hypothetical protein
LGQTKSKFVNRFTKWLKIRDGKKHVNSITDDHQQLFDLLTRLYAHEDGVIEELLKIRLNPDFTSFLRSDLEFFIPEISSFYLRGKFEEQEKLLELLTSACRISFFFSHRLYFFFKAVISTQGSQDVKSECLAALQEMEDMCEVEDEDNMLYLANSKDLICYIKKLHVDGLYSNLQDSMPGDVKGNIYYFQQFLIKYRANHTPTQT